MLQGVKATVPEQVYIKKIIIIIIKHSKGLQKKTPLNMPCICWLGAAKILQLITIHRGGWGGDVLHYYNGGRVVG